MKEATYRQHPSQASGFAKAAEARPSAATAQKERHWEDWAVFGMVLVWNLVMVWMVVFRLNLFLTDAMARTRSAWQVFFSADPKLTNIGFVWSPLPTILQLPLVLLPPLRAYGLSANLVTALAGAGTAGLLNAMARRLRWSRPARYVMLAAFVLNPMIFFYAANGMSEMTLVFCAVAAIFLYVEWHHTRRRSLVVMMGLATSLAFLARYDALVFAAFLTGVLFIHTLAGRGGNWVQAEGTAVAFLVPVVYVVLLWLFFNWSIMGDPLHFATSPYSNSGQIKYQLAVLPEIAELKGDLLRTICVAFDEVWRLFPPFVLFSATAVLVAARRRDLLGFGLVALGWAFPIFSALNIFAGQSALFLRYFILVIPAAFVLAIWIIPSLPRARLPGTVAVLLLLSLSALASLGAMRDATEWGQWNDIFVHALFRQERVDTWAPERELAQYINDHVHGREVLVDDFQGYRVIFFSGHPEYFLGTSDRDFHEALRQPYGKVTYVLASEAKLEGTLNQVNIAYPELYELGGSWVVLEKEIWVWRLYRVVAPPS